MAPTISTDLEDAIVDACQKHQHAHQRDDDYRAAVFIDTDYFVKFDGYTALWPEIATQQYISQYASESQEADAPRIAEVIHHFRRDNGMMYFVMEYIKLMDPPSDMFERTEDALKWLSRVPAPPGHVLGPLGGGRIRHSFFKGFRAPLLFSSVEALERYMDKGRSRLPKLAANPVQPVNISDERLIFTQADMHPSNFGIDEHGKTVLSDFGEIALLPESFAAYTMASGSHAGLAKSMGWWSEPKMTSMAATAHCLWMTAAPKLGLDEHGYPMEKSSKRQTGAAMA